MARLHKLEEVENVTRMVNTAVADEQCKTGGQGPWKLNRPQFDGKQLSREPQDVQCQVERKLEEHLMRGKGPSPNVMCFRCQGKGHFANNPVCPTFGKGGGVSHQLQDQPQLKATRVSDRDGADVSEGLSNEVKDAGNWDDSSQWELVLEGEGSLHSHDVAQQLTKIPVADIVLEPEEDNLVYIWAVQKKVVTTQKENLLQAVMHPKID